MNFCCVYVKMLHVWLVLEEGIGSPETRVTEGSDPITGAGGFKKQVLLTTEASSRNQDFSSLFETISIASSIGTVLLFSRGLSISSSFSVPFFIPTYMTSTFC